MQAETWKRTVTSFAERVITDGETVWPSIRSRAGGVIDATSIVPEPAAGQPLTLTGGVTAFAFTTAVGFDVACAEPSAFLAVTRTRSVSPTSAFFTRYDEVVAPPMFEQFAPARLD